MRKVFFIFCKFAVLHPQTRLARGYLGLSGPHVRSAVEEVSRDALASATSHPAAASGVRARPATPRSASVSSSLPHKVQNSATCGGLTVCVAAPSEVGCPPGRLYRECERGEGCPFSCAQVSGREGCYLDICEEGCHCPMFTYQHRGACLKVNKPIQV